MNQFATLLLLLSPVHATAIDQLGSDHFQARQAASKTLAALSPLSYPSLLSSLDSPDAEVRSRVRHLHLSAWLGWIAANRDTLPWLDMHPDQCVRDQVHVYLQLADPDKIIPHAWPWLGYRRGTAAWLCERIDAGMTEKELRETLAIMRERERAWCQQNGRGGM